MEQRKEVSLEEICSFAQKSPEQIVNMLIAAGKVNRGHYKSFMKFEGDEIEAMRHRIRYNEATIGLYETDLKVKAISSPGFPRTIEEVQRLQTTIDSNNRNWEDALEGAKAEVGKLNEEIKIKTAALELANEMLSICWKKPIPALQSFFYKLRHKKS